MALLESEVDDGVAVLTLNRPEAHNAISGALADELAETLHEISPRRDVRVVVIKGAGEKAFCAGNDLKERQHLDADGKWEQRTRSWIVNKMLRDLPQPTIAAIQGWCLGGGLELALYCDLRIASDDAVFSFPEMHLGAYPGAGAAIALPRLIGRARAKELFFTGRRVAAEEALAMGLVGWLTEKANLFEKAVELAEQIKLSSPLGLAAVKRMIEEGSDLAFDEADALNDQLRRPLEATQDYREGIAAFFEKRPAVFVGK